MTTLQRAAIYALTFYILAGPGLVQIMHVNIPEIRSWRMYSSVGIGAPYGAFEIVGPSGVERRIDLVDAMGLDSIQSIQRYTGSGSLKADFHAETALEATARSICAELRQDQSLRFIGRLAARGGWLRIRKDHAELCEMD